MATSPSFLSQVNVSSIAELATANLVTTNIIIESFIIIKHYSAIEEFLVLIPLKKTIASFFQYKPFSFGQKLIKCNPINDNRKTILNFEPTYIS